MDPQNTIAEALAFYQEKILAVGLETEVRTRIQQLSEQIQQNIGKRPETQTINIAGKCLLPGFIDAHLHPGFYFYKKTQLDLSDVRSYDELRAKIQKAASTTNPGEMIAGFDLMEDLFTNPEERRFPTRWDLDSMCPHQPCLIMRHDGHICAVNSLTLTQLNITSSNVKERTPMSGEIQMNSQGIPTGIFTEEATGIVLEALPIPETTKLLEACKETSRELASFGITTCGAIVQAGDIGVEGKAGAMIIPLLEAFIKQDLIPQDYVFYISTNRPKVLKRYQRLFHKLSTSEYRFTVGGIKIYADGSFGASTSCMFEPFSDSPTARKGFLLHTKDEFIALFQETLELGFQIACHAIGDKANAIIVELFQTLLKDHPEYAPKCRIEHASILTPETLEKIAQLGITLVCQPAFITSEYTWLERRLGPSRVKQTYPFRSILDAGVRLAGASDAPIEPANVLTAIQACVTRHGFVPEQAITVEEALKMYTLNAAYALGQEHIKGSLEQGKFADLILLDQNPLTVPPENLNNIKILATWHRGSKIYPKP
ncbi:MAG: amidohydrolase [Candidatus Helarchaeota archaeon]